LGFLLAIVCCGAVALQQQVLCAFLWFARSWTAFLHLSYYPLPCQNMGVLARESLLAASQGCVLVFRW